MSEHLSTGGGRRFRRGGTAGGSDLLTLSPFPDAAPTPGPSDEAEGGDLRDGGPSGERGTPSPPPEPAAEPPEDEQRWLRSWQANEIRSLHGTVEDLDRRLRRRTVALVGALAFGTIAVAAVLAGMLLDGPAPPAVPPPAAAEAPAGPAEALRAGLAAAGERIEGLEAGAAEREAALARLRAELEDTRAEAVALEEQLETSRREVERLNAALARATGRPEAGAAPGAAVEAAAGTGTAPATGTAGRGGGPGAAARDRDARPRGATEQSGQHATSGRDFDALIGPLREALAETKERIERLQAPGAGAAGTVDPSAGEDSGARAPGGRPGPGGLGTKPPR